MQTNDLAAARDAMAKARGAVAPADRDLMQRLKELLLDFSSTELASIGVTIKREEGEWEWLRDAFTVALEREGREKAAATIRGNDMSKSCSIGVSKSFLVELAKLLDEREGSTTSLMGEAASLFRMYEKSHRAKIMPERGESDTNNRDATAKAERNRAMAEKLEEHLRSIGL